MKFLITSLFSFAVVLLGNSHSTFAEKSPAKNKSVRLSLNWVAEPEFGGFYAAEKARIYERNHLAVNILTGGAGTPTVQMVAAGKVEFGISSADEVILSRSKGADVVALFAVYQTSPTGIMVHESRGFKSIADVFGPGILAVQRAYPFFEFLKKKYPMKGVKIVPYGGGISEFLHNKNFSQQVFVTSEPLLAKKQGGDPKTFLVADEGFNPYTSVLVTRGDYLRQHPDIVQAMVAASREGWKNYLADPRQTNEWMAGLNKSMDLGTFKEVAATQIPLIVTSETKKYGLGYMSEERWNKMTSDLVDLKVISKPIPAKECFRNF
jgi:NitT/TauT family transport system substrate-binding protein